MTRDLFHFFEADLVSVYEAYRTVIQKDFDAFLQETKYNTIKGGLKYSFKYNMNGGAFTVHFMPYNNGTAVAIRYSIAQLFGARYQKHDKDLTEFVVKKIKIKPKDVVLNINDFLRPENMLIPEDVENISNNKINVEESADTKIEQGTLSQSNVFCTQCGNKINVGDKFCGKCGHKIS